MNTPNIPLTHADNTTIDFPHVTDGAFRGGIASDTVKN